MKTISVNASSHYEIHIGSGLLERCGDYLRTLTASHRVAVVTDTIVAPLYLARLEAALHSAGFSEVASFVFPQGEQHKTLQTAAELYHFFTENHITRTDFVIALGGGVVGDVTGFAASTYLRGIRFVQVPTTLLAQVDSSVGGKTAVDLPDGKNLVGTFWQPSLVLCDTATLSTLSAEIFSDGAAEVIKYGAIRDANLFEMLCTPDYAKHLEEIIYRCICIKRDIVERDEFDTGERMLLNFGHTLAHAIECESGYTVTHGKAVAIGMVMMTKASVLAGITAPEAIGKLLEAYKNFGLNTVAAADCATLAELCRRDKKRDAQELSIICLKKIGDAQIHRMKMDAFEQFICEGNQ